MHAIHWACMYAAGVGGRQATHWVLPRESHWAPCSKVTNCWSTQKLLAHVPPISQQSHVSVCTITSRVAIPTSVFPGMFALSPQQQSPHVCTIISEQSPLSPQQQSPIVLCALSCHYVSCSYTPPTSNQTFIHSLYESCAGFDLCRSSSFSLLLLTIQY